VMSQEHPAHSARASCACKSCRQVRSALHSVLGDHGVSLLPLAPHARVARVAEEYRADRTLFPRPPHSRAWLTPFPNSHCQLLQAPGRIRRPQTHDFFGSGSAPRPDHQPDLHADQQEGHPLFHANRAQGGHHGGCRPPSRIPEEKKDRSCRNEAPEPRENPEVKRGRWLRFRRKRGTAGGS
ncbi:MAG: hypothetical protein RIS76_2738, partial [Verrucomicrobiota bacterium]